MVVLVKNNGKPVSVGVDQNCFPIENGKVVGVASQEIGARAMGKAKEYNAALELAQFAWDNQIFDTEEETKGLR
jgi:hypothetical protein